MAEVRPSITYVVSLSAHEFKLVTRSLAGLTKPDSKEAAECLALNKALLTNRASFLTDLKTAADGALANANEHPTPTEKDGG